MAKDSHWMEHAAEKMKKKGTVGSFGKATSKKISAGLAKGGKSAKKAGFAKAAKEVAAKHKK
jgi:hypothetical protein